MPNLERRVQFLLDEPRYRRVTSEARRRRVSVATVVRDAIDQMTSGAETRRDAIAGILAAQPMAVPADPAELRRELDAARDQLLRSSPPA
jgi:hypothetical protein